MNKFVTTALALSAAGSLAYAGTGDSEWLELDREITSLTTPVASSAQGGINWSALIRNTAVYSDDDIFTGAVPPGKANDIFGFRLADVDLAANGSVGDFGWRVSGDVGNGAWVTEDAYVNWNCGEMFETLFGRHKANVLRSTSVSPEGLLFPNRTGLGSVFDGWQNGIVAMGSFEDMMRWSLDAQNGANGVQSDHRWVARFEYDLGEGAGDVEGALGAGNDFAGTFGFTFVKNDAQDNPAGGAFGGGSSDNSMYALDFWGTAGPIGFGAEIASIADDLFLQTDEDYFATGLSTGPVAGLVFAEDDPGVTPTGNAGGSTPWDLTLSYLINEEFEAAFRYENFDNALDTTVLSLGLNWYQSGHNAKWHFGYADISNDSAPAGGLFSYTDGSVWQVAVSVGASG
jgi:hypothetical protein